MGAQLGDRHELSELAGEYATLVVDGSQWPLTGEDVDLSSVTIETSSRMKRRHGVCSASDDGLCTIRLSEQTYERAGFDAIKETIRHELVHAYQYQSDGIEPGHGESFTQWVDPLALAGRCNSHYETRPDDYRYNFYCAECGFIGGRHRWSVAVRRAIQGEQICGDCETELRVDGPDGTLETVPDQWADDSEPVRYQFFCENCGLIGSRKQRCKTVRMVVRGAVTCRGCGSTSIEVRGRDGKTLTRADIE